MEKTFKCVNATASNKYKKKQYKGIIYYKKSEVK